MIKIFQKSWFGIDFKSFSHLNPKKLADAEFYKNFYHVFYKTFSNYHDLPNHYIVNKKKVADFLSSIIQIHQANSILSIGSGNGIVEKALIELLPTLQLVAYEPYQYNSTWLETCSNIKLVAGTFPDCLPEKQTYDLVYLNCVDYALSDTDYIALLSAIKSITAAPIILTEVIKPYANGLSYVIYWIKQMLAAVKAYDLGQWWGYLRHLHEHQQIFDKAGYSMSKITALSTESMCLEISPKKCIV